MNSKIIKSWHTLPGYRAEIRQGLITCGYVGIGNKHPLFGKSYEHVGANVHGGLTYAGEREGLWWFGFDTGHWLDEIPGVQQGKRWTLEELVEETEELAQYLALMDRQLRARSDRG